MSETIRQLMIRGRVQGVGFRYWVEQEARARRLEGWVRNRRDGSVEALLAGPAGGVSQMIAVCPRGPSSARVEAVEGGTASADALKLGRAGGRVLGFPTL